MIRILEFADRINKADFVDSVIQRIDRSEFEISVCVRTEEHNIARPEFPADVKYRLLPGNSRVDAMQTAWKLARLLREWNIDILHAHHFEQIFVAWLATRLRPATRLVVGRHYSDAIYRQTSALRRRALLAVEGLSNRAASRIIVPSVFVRDILLRQGVGSERVDVVLYGFDPAKYEDVRPEDVKAARTEFDMEGRFVIGNFSRLHEEKGHRYLLDAVAEARPSVPDLRVLIVGEGGERRALERRVAELALGDIVRFAGWRRDAMAIMAAVDAVVQPTLQEAFSQVMCEALWMSKPLVITDVSGVRDIIEHEQQALIVPKEDSGALANAVVRIAGDAELRRRLGERGRAAVGDLTIDRMIGEFEAAFRRSMSPREAV